MLPVDVVGMSQTLVRIPSVNPYYDPTSAGEGAVLTWLKQWGLENNFEVSEHEVFTNGTGTAGRSNLVLKFRNQADSPHLLFNGHMDTVGVKGMAIESFGGEIRDGRLWGRGSGDMKGQNTCMMVAALLLKANPSAWRGTITLGFVVDEEYRFSGVKELMKHIAKPDYAIVGEPTDMQVVRGCKGVLRFVVTAKGRACHSSDPKKGKSAIVAISETVLVLEDFFEKTLALITYPEFGCSTGSIGVIEGGSGINIVPEHCAIQVDIRIVPGQNPEDTYRQIQACVLERCKRVAGIEWNFSAPIVVEKAFDTPADTDLVKTACRVLNCERPQVVLYSCDASTIAAHGVSTVVVGPGQIEQAHTARESIAIVELQQAVGQYEQLALALLK